MAENIPVSFAVTYAIMNKERYLDLSDEHRKIIDDLSGLPMSLKGAESFDGADERSKSMIADADKGYTWSVVSDAEHEKMDAAVANGLKTIFADYASKGIDNAETIYNDLHN